MLIIGFLLGTWITLFICAICFLGYLKKELIFLRKVQQDIEKVEKDLK